MHAGLNRAFRVVFNEALQGSRLPVSSSPMRYFVLLIASFALASSALASDLGQSKLITPAPETSDEGEMRRRFGDMMHVAEGAFLSEQGHSVKMVRVSEWRLRGSVLASTRLSCLPGGGGCRAYRSLLIYEAGTGELVAQDDDGTNRIVGRGRAHADGTVFLNQLGGGKTQFKWDSASQHLVFTEVARRHTLARYRQIPREDFDRVVEAWRAEVDQRRADREQSAAFWSAVAGAVTQAYVDVQTQRLSQQRGSTSSTHASPQTALGTPAPRLADSGTSSSPSAGSGSTPDASAVSHPGAPLRFMLSVGLIAGPQATINPSCHVYYTVPGPAGWPKPSIDFNPQSFVASHGSDAIERCAARIDQRYARIRSQYPPAILWWNAQSNTSAAPRLAARPENVVIEVN